MRALHRRLDTLQRIVDQLEPSPVLTALALGTSDGDLALVGGEWIPCPDARAVLENHHGPLKVYGGFDPREVLACLPRG
jgi:hypothetical protein